MPFITAEEVKTIRNAIKAALPDYKVSVTKEHHSSVHVNVMAGPLAIEGGRMSVNHYHYQNQLADQPEVKAVIDTIMQAIDSVHPQKTLYEDGDYGNVPNYYQSIGFGKWDKPYQQV